MQNELKSNEWRRIWVLESFKIIIQKVGRNISAVLQNWLLPEIRYPLFKLQKFQDSEKSLPEWCRMKWNLMNDEKFGCLKLLKLNYRSGEPNNSAVLENWFAPKKLGLPSLVFVNLETLRKILLNHTECIEIQWMTKNFGR